MSRKWLILVVTLVLLLVTMPLLAACDDDDDEEETRTVQPTKTSQPTETVQPAETVEPTEPVDGCTKEATFKVGTISAVIGISAEARDVSEVVALDEFNEAGGIRVGDTCYMFENVFQDDKQTTAGAVSAIQKLLYEEKVNAVIHIGAGAQPQVWRPYTEEEEVIAFSQSAAIGDWIGEEYPYAFRVSYDNTSLRFIMLDWLSKNRPDIKTIHGVQTLRYTDEGVEKVFKEAALPEYGIDYTGSEWGDVETRDFYPHLLAAMEGDPDALLLDTYKCVQTIKQARELGFEGTFIIAGPMPEFVFSMLSAEELEGTISFTPSVESPLVPQYYKDYKEAYKERKGGYPYSYGQFGSYLCMYYLAAAIKAAGSMESDKVKEVLETQTLTLEFPNGETLEAQMSGAEYFGVNHSWVMPQYLSVVRNKTPDVIEVFTAEKQTEYLDIYFKYLEK